MDTFSKHQLRKVEKLVAENCDKIVLKIIGRKYIFSSDVETILNNMDTFSIDEL